MTTDVSIKKVNIAEKIGEFYLKNNSQNYIGIKWDKTLSIEKLTNNIGRVYIFTVNDNIYKIGKSICKGGIRSTIKFYTNSMNGNPGPSRFIMQLLIRNELLLKNKVDVYLIPVESSIAHINGLFGDVEQNDSSNPIYTESKCLNDYKSIANKYPTWNFKENNKRFPIELERKYTKRRVEKNNGKSSNQNPY
jgi:hypothetical protein